ncbi:MAG: cyclic nucleotide-binding/CBS domain-containing protein [Candidatus Woesearchaeota archaeon]
MAMNVREVMRTKVATCSANITVLGACKILKKQKTSTVVIIDKNKHVLGVFSERDLVDRVVVKGLPTTTKISQVMTSPVICGDITQTDVQIAHLIIAKKIKKVPILQKQRLVGIVAESDLLKHLARSVFSYE